MKSLIKTIFVLSNVLCLGACSVGMALSGKKDPDLTVIKKGANRAEIELQLGSPIKVATLDNGNTVAVYKYEIGNEPSAGRAVAHGAMDVLTLGLWEVVGTPVELATGDNHQIMITYDKDDNMVAARLPK